MSRPIAQSVEINVCDRGIDISAEKRSGIFERFYQAHHDGHSSGMSLGLHISREIIELHGGSIEADFPADGGTRMIVRLPVDLGAEVVPSGGS